MYWTVVGRRVQVAAVEYVVGNAHLSESPDDRIWDIDRPRSRNGNILLKPCPTLRQLAAGSIEIETLENRTQVQQK